MTPWAVASPRRPNVYGHDAFGVALSTLRTTMQSTCRLQTRRRASVCSYASPEMDRSRHQHENPTDSVILGDKRKAGPRSECPLATLRPARFLLHRGIKTLALRVDAQNATALALARALAALSNVERVHYTGLPEDPSHHRASTWFSGHGGLLSFRLAGGVPAAERLLSRLESARVAPSLGGVETFASRPATTSHAGLSSELRRGMGVSDELIRVALGLEDPEDLIADFRQALA